MNVKDKKMCIINNEVIIEIENEISMKIENAFKKPNLEMKDNS